MDILIVGAGGHGRVVLDIVRAAKQHKVIGFLDANQDLHGTEIAGVPVLGALNLLPKLKAKGVTGAVVAIGDNRVRRSYAQKLKAAGLTLINAIHPSAVISPTVSLGQNLVVAAGAILCAEAKLADSVIINNRRRRGSRVRDRGGSPCRPGCATGRAGVRGGRGIHRHRGQRPPLPADRGAGRGGRGGTGAAGRPRGGDGGGRARAGHQDRSRGGRSLSQGCNGVNG